MHMSSLRLSALTALLILHTAHAQTRFDADPDFISSGYSWNGVAQVNIGDLIAIRGLILGGMVVIRNEARFNQGLLPNHNWRGFVHAGYRLAPKAFTKRELAVVTAIEHGSAHPSDAPTRSRRRLTGTLRGDTPRTWARSTSVAARGLWVNPGDGPSWRK
jgi:hypothetical protein